MIISKFFHQGHQTLPSHNDDCKNDFTDSVSMLAQIKMLPKKSKNLTCFSCADFHGQISPQARN
jgi:hypothetical protein